MVITSAKPTMSTKIGTTHSTQEKNSTTETTAPRIQNPLPTATNTLPANFLNSNGVAPTRRRIDASSISRDPTLPNRNTPAGDNNAIRNANSAATVAVRRPGVTSGWADAWAGTPYTIGAGCHTYWPWTSGLGGGGTCGLPLEYPALNLQGGNWSLTVGF